MSLLLIARALEKHLAGMTPAVDIAPENGTYQPTTGVPYQALAFLPGVTETPTLTQLISIERGFFQVMVCYPSAMGPVAARARAEAIRERFVAGLNLFESGQRVEILAKPSIGPAVPTTGWYCIPVRIQFKAVIQP